MKIAHDPEDGCYLCPLAEKWNDDSGTCSDIACIAIRSLRMQWPLLDAPAGCPLRARPVIVAGPGWTAVEQQTGGPCRMSIEHMRGLDAQRLRAAGGGLFECNGATSGHHHIAIRYGSEPCPLCSCLALIDAGEHENMERE